MVLPVAVGFWFREENFAFRRNELHRCWTGNVEYGHFGAVSGI